jgi:hypothetical protein
MRTLKPCKGGSYHARIGAPGALGIDLNAATPELLDKREAYFARSFQSPMDSIAQKGINDQKEVAN